MFVIPVFHCICLVGSVTVYGGNVSTVLLTKLQVETEYSIGVAALSTAEELEQVGPVLVTTPWGEYQLYIVSIHSLVKYLLNHCGLFVSDLI